MAFIEKLEWRHEKTLATLPRTTRGQPVVLTGSPDGKTMLYCNGNSVILRNVEDPSHCDIYTEHSHPTTVARYAPSGFYIASGDTAGKLRIWDTTQKEHILKSEYPVISGAIRDVCWSPDSKRIAVVGEGKDRFGHVFLFDTGTSNGSLSGQSKAMTSVDYRPERPYRIISASEDNSVAIFEGPPFKFKMHHHKHTRFAWCVRYQPGTGAIFASGGADGKLFLYDGVEGEPIGELIDPSVKGGAAHAGGIYALEFTKDGKKILTASGDKTGKLWNIDDKSLLATFTMGTTIDDQQLGCLIAGEKLFTVSLSGVLNLVKESSPNEKPTLISGHNKPITSLALTDDRQTLFTADGEGHIVKWNLSTGVGQRLTPKVHSSQIVGLALTSVNTLTSVGWDDNVATVDVSDDVSNIKATAQKLPSQPRGVTVSKDGKTIIIACQKQIVVLRNGQQIQHPMAAEPLCVALSPDGFTFAVGAQDNKVHVLRVENNTIVSTKEITHHQPITSCAYSNDGSMLVVTDSARRVVPYATASDLYNNASAKEWTFHTAKPISCAWSPDNRRIATGALDTNLIVWDLSYSGEHPIIVKGAHAMSVVSGVAWLSETQVVTTGHDSNVKIWSIDPPKP